MENKLCKLAILRFELRSSHLQVTVKLNLWQEVLEYKSLRLSVLEFKSLRLGRSKTKHMECKFSGNEGPNDIRVKIGDQEV